MTREEEQILAEIEYLENFKKQVKDKKKLKEIEDNQK